MAECERHQPEKTLLHEIVREQLEGFLANSRYGAQGPPRFVEQELRSFLRCGVGYEVALTLMPLLWWSRRRQLRTTGRA